MEENTFDDFEDFDVRLKFAFETLIEIVISYNGKVLVSSMKDELVEKLFGLARQLNPNFSRAQILLIYEKLIFKINAQPKPISCRDEADEEMSVNFEAEHWRYVNNSAELAEFARTDKL